MGGIYPESISVSSTYDFERDIVLTVLWSMPTIKHDVDNDMGLKKSVASRPANTTLKLDTLDGYKSIESILIATAWTLGAFDLCRLEKSPINTTADPYDPRYGLAVDFAATNMDLDGTPLFIGDRADNKTIEQAANDGYIVWRFVPLALCKPDKIKKCLTIDATLNSDASRPGQPCFNLAKWYRPRQPGLGHEHQYQFGKKHGY